MRNVFITITLLSLTFQLAFAEEMTLEEIKADFKATINHFNYETEPQANSPQRVRNRVVENTDSNEILNLEEEFFDSVKTQNAAPAVKRKRSR